MKEYRIKKLIPASAIGVMGYDKMLVAMPAKYVEDGRVICYRDKKMSTKDRPPITFRNQKQKFNGHGAHVLAYYVWEETDEKERHEEPAKEDRQAV